MLEGEGLVLMPKSALNEKISTSAAAACNSALFSMFRSEFQSKFSVAGSG